MFNESFVPKDSTKKDEVSSNPNSEEVKSDANNISNDDPANDSNLAKNSNGSRTYNGRGGIGNAAARGMDKLANGANNLSNRLNNKGNKLNDYSNNHKDSKLGNAAGSMGDKLNKVGNKIGNFGSKLNSLNKGVQTVNNINNVRQDPSTIGEMESDKVKEKVGEAAKEGAIAILKKFLLPFLPFLLLIILIIIAIIAAVILILLLLDSNGSFGGSGSNTSYNSSCNYEETTVIVMDGNNKEVLATQSLQDYVIGVACPEVGFCNGNLKNVNSEYVKANYVAIKTFVLANGSYNSSTKTVTVRASTRNQQWCHVDKGCYVTKTNVYVGSGWYYYNTYPGDYDKSKADGEVTGEYSFTEEDLEIARKYYEETYGDLILSTSYNSSITALGSNDYVGYKSSTQNYWKSAAGSGMSYGEVLKSTASSGVSNSSNYVDKDIYKLSKYCAATGSNDGNSSANVSTDYVQWMIDFAADDSHGYSMDNRLMNPDVDCSSFVYYALINNGYTTFQLGTYPFSTSGMEYHLMKAGFEKLSYDFNSLKEGDILWYPKGFNGHSVGHTEVYIGDGKSVGAHSNYDSKPGDSSGREVSVVSITKPYKAIFRKK